MYRQKDVALTITCPSEDLHENYIPSSFDEYLMKTRMRHEGHRRTRKSKLQSDYEELDVILFFVQIRYKALHCILRPLLTHLFFCADRHHQGHRRRRAHPRGGRVLRRGLLLRDRRAHPQRRHGLARRHQHPHLRDQFLHAPDKNARPVDRPPALHDTVHRAGVREVQGGWQERGLCKCSPPPTMSQSPTLSSLAHPQPNSAPRSTTISTSACSSASASTSTQSGGPAHPAYFSSRLRARSLCDTFFASLYF